MDALAALLDGVRARSAAFCRTSLEPPWALRIADGAPIALATILRGRAWIVPDDGEALAMRAGDVCIVKGPDPYTVADDPATAPTMMVRPGNRLTTTDGADLTDAMQIGPNAYGAVPDGSTVVVSGTYQVGGDVSERLLNALPSLPAVVLARRAEVRYPILELLAEELGRDSAGQQAVLDRLLDLALIATLRAWFDRSDAAAPGWYSAQADPLVGTALRLIHEHPARSWTVASLAGATGTSRAGLARRFAALVGEPPMTYLTGWRIALAADLLRSSDNTIDAIARRIGYANAFALSAAFKRLRGISPSRYRQLSTTSP